MDTNKSLSVATEVMMGFFLMQQDTPQPAEACLPFDEPGLDPAQDRLPQAFQDNLFGQDCLKEPSAPDRVFDQRPITFQGWEQRARAEVARCQPRDGPLKHGGMERLLPGLSRKKAPHAWVRRQRGLRPGAIVSQALSILQELQESGQRFPFVRTDQHRESRSGSNRIPETPPGMVRSPVRAPVANRPRTASRMQ